MRQFCADVRFGLRSLAKAPAFTAVVILTLALGIGANTAVFSLARAVLLRSLPYPDSGRLMFVSRAYPGFPQGGGNFTYAALHDMQQMNTSFDTLAAFQCFGSVALTESTEPTRVGINFVTPSYLDLLGMKISAGRKLEEKDDWYGGAEPVVVISHSYWQSQFGGRDVIGQTIHLNQHLYTIVGISDPGFRDAPGEQDEGWRVDAWTPLGNAYQLTGMSNPKDRMGAIIWGVGHLKPGVTIAQAREDIAKIGNKLAETYPETDKGFGLVARPLQDQLIGHYYKPVWILLAASFFILLIGCANVSNLLLTRLIGRQREFAVRAALGASLKRLVAQLFAENLIITVAASVLGVMAATWSLTALRYWAGTNLSPVVDVKIDARLLTASIAISIFTALLFGITPAFWTCRTNLLIALNQGGKQQSTGTRKSSSKALVVIEVALAVIVLAGAALLLKGFRRLTTTELGFDTHNLMTFRVDLRSARYADPQARVQLAKRLTDKLRSTAGIQSITLWGPSRIGRATWVYIAVPEGRNVADHKDTLMMNRHSVNPEALQNLSIRLLRGRMVNWGDTIDKPLVAVISESVAKRMWPGEDPLGKRMRGEGVNAPLITVVGLAADARHVQRFDMTDAANGIAPAGLGPQYDAYFPYAQRPNQTLSFGLRYSGDSTAALQTFKRALLELDSTLPVYDVAVLEDRLAEQEYGSRVITELTGAYALLGLFLAAFGLFGVLAHNVSRRTQEIGIRMALGAMRANVLAMVLREGLLLTALGIFFGVLGGLVLTRTMTTVLFGVSPTDPTVFATISLLLLMTAAVASLLPAWRAARVDPIEALRTE